ncbi:hypothetical protein [Streptococcus dysgalactiae]|uniref:Hypothetical membrane associated protein n=1 Tax=Streptococcus dysgalactiae TaxID=1334 RepID=A0A9X9SHY7_STRDY|nr:hypothetical protein [Streptococcus dysgalactiae]VTS48915.1 hypothetical membrane associated protein [Streptococcus dysgalactiae subsp. equisimilis]VTS50066.1 hypothetical membrane associated protein [Streptococcus dysgalactiae subsp. equisimilis]VTS78104.1 hypothetical membrane associated protein [Streptococcus dysgalactiae]
MTTKKKSILGISYLSVAVLGASLLMAKPVSAEEMGVSQGQATSLATETSPYGIVEVGEITEEGHERILYSTQDPYLKGREDGYNAGYQDGQKPGAFEYPEDYTPQPKSNPYNSTTTKNKEWYDSGYRDNYYAGYRNGWDNNHYIWSTLKTVWNIITYYLGYSN